MKKIVLVLIILFIVGACTNNSSYDQNNNVEEEQHEEQSEQFSFELIDGELGEYGQVVKVDSYEYIFYYVPAGKYKVELLDGMSLTSKYAWVEKNDSSKTEEGYTEYPIAAKVIFEKGNKETEVTIGSDEHLLLVDSVKLRLTLCEE